MLTWRNKIINTSGLHLDQIDYFSLSVARGMSAYAMRTCSTYCSAMLYIYYMVDYELLNVDTHYDSLIKYAIFFFNIGYSCLNKECGHNYILSIRCHKYCYKHLIVVNM